MAVGLSEDFYCHLQPLREAVDAALAELVSPTAGCPPRLAAAMRYSLLAPGKRMRPLLCLLACQAVSGEWQAAVPSACAVECVHVYSLIHDDLPAMDNDDLRRGQATCHIAFDEATAILAGDSLQMLAMQVLSQQLPPQVALASVSVLAEAAGCRQLVGGQADDLAAEGRFGPLELADTSPLEFLQSIHRRKTSALIEASLQLGGLAGGATPEQLSRLASYGRAVGLAFQIVDDCLDVESTAEHLGKNTRKDSELGKLTYPGIVGLERSRQLAQQLIGEACEAVAVFKDRGQRLSQLARFVVERKV